MNIRKILLFFSFILPTMFCPAQNIVIEYELLTVKNAPDYNNTKLQKELEKSKTQLGEKIDEVIAYCPQEMENFIPQSPLTNFLTDAVVEIGNQFCEANGLDFIDFAILNAGGIRAPLKAGNVTVGNLYEISPFENYIVIAEIKGSEVTKIFKRFTTKTCQPTSKQISITFAGDYVYQLLMHGQAIDPDKIYRMATLDFIANGGDNILKDIEIINIVNTGILGRSGYIDYIKRLTTKGQNISAKIDDRVKIIPQPK